MPIGDTVLSDHLDYRLQGKLLTARRFGTNWKVRSEFNVVTVELLAYEGWDGADWSVKWRGDGFVHTNHDKSVEFDALTIGYVGHSAQRWECAWRLKDLIFRHIRCT
jgi:hypothetical protein